MLSRGFTVEGLTTVYFRRVAAAMDTQLQLARWNGYRSYFEDLIRIYFGVAEPGPKSRPVRNLYKEFAWSSQQDAVFRERLRRYGEEGTSPRIELPEFPSIGSEDSLPPTAPAKRRGLVELSGGPIELGKRGDGIPVGSPEVAAVADQWGHHEFAHVPICDVCLKAGKADRIKAAIGEVPSASVRTLLRAMVARGASPLTREESDAVAKAHDQGAWRLGVLGTVKPLPGGAASFGQVDVPVRLRSWAAAPTLSTGEWNRWLRYEVGDKCNAECEAATSSRLPFMLLVPYVTDQDTTKRWGAIIQIHGRSSASRGLVVKPSKR
jgi:hypothetical protein